MSPESSSWATSKMRRTLQHHPDHLHPSCYSLCYVLSVSSIVAFFLYHYVSPKSRLLHVSSLLCFHHLIHFDLRSQSVLLLDRRPANSLTGGETDSRSQTFSRFQLQWGCIGGLIATLMAWPLATGEFLSMTLFNCMVSVKRFLN